jgi:hypothetical protein
MRPPPAEKQPTEGILAARAWTLAQVWVAAVLIGYLAITVLGSSTAQRFLSR